jgi:hypothetical protein
MSNFVCKRYSHTALLYVWIVCIGSLLPTFAQQHVDINWITLQPSSPPITVDKTTPVIVTVTNVNDMLYAYFARVASIPRSPVDIQPVMGGFGVALGGTDPCKPLGDTLDQLDKAFSAPELHQDVTNNTLPRSVPLAATRAAYADAKQQINALTSKVGSCTPANDANHALVRMNFYLNTVQVDWDKADAKPHTFVFNTVLAPLNDYTIYLLEQYNGKTTDRCTNKDSAGKATGVECQVAYSPATNLITASGGFLLTQLTSPTYDRSNVPNGTTVLTVSNNGPLRSAFTGLVNVSVPHCENSDASFGCAISVGPAFALAGNSNTSNIGLFTGISLHLWHYLYLTPGVHVGQYPGFPAGFTQAGQVIPPSYTGKLDPINRTSVRFAFAITFKGWNVVKLNATSQGTVKPGKATTNP